MGRNDLVNQANKIYLGGGGKADIRIAGIEDIDFSQSSEYIAKALFGAGYLWGKKRAIGSGIDRLAGDRGTTGEYEGRPLVEYIGEGYLKALKDDGITDPDKLRQARAVVTGKRLSEGGLEARKDATGLGTWSSYVACFAKKQGLPISQAVPHLLGKTMFSRGCGSCANRAIIEAGRAGMRTVVADFNFNANLGGIIMAENGFTEEEARTMFDISVSGKQFGGDVCKWIEAQPAERKLRVLVSINDQPKPMDTLKKLNEAIHDCWQGKLDCPVPDVIFDSATQMTMTGDNAQYVPASAIFIEGGNGVSTPKASEIMDSKKIIRVTGILANSGGVYISWFEWAQEILGVKFESPMMEDAIRELMKTNIEATLDLITVAQQLDLELTTERAYYAVAIARGLADRKAVAKQIS